jgi:starch-binding outer membrane protein SusE/F
MVSPGVFEIFSKLKAGTYQFVDGISGTPNKYFVFDDGGVNAIGAGGTTTFTGADKIMRIILDFNNVNSSSMEVKSVQLWYSFGNTFWFTLPYTNNGVWRYNGHNVVLQLAPWNALEERYKYKMVVNDGSGDRDLWLNSSFGDPAPQDGVYPSTVAYRTVDVNRNEGSQYDWSWKFDRPYIQNQVVDFWLSLRGSEGVYTQNYQRQ